MILAFTLTMPRVNTWNGHWTGEGKLYVRTRTLAGPRAKAAESLAGECFDYHWDDGWSASVHVRLVDAYEAAKLRKQSQGFWGYEWMIDSILDYGEIRTPGEGR